MCVCALASLSFTLLLSGIINCGCKNKLFGCEVSWSLEMQFYKCFELQWFMAGVLCATRWRYLLVCIQLCLFMYRCVSSLFVYIYINE